MGEGRYDVAVIGAGPAGQRASLELARHGNRVALVEARSRVGGTCLHEGTIPSKALRTAILVLSNWRYRCLVDCLERAPARLEGRDLLAQVDRVVESELDVIENLMECHSVDVVRGSARFKGPNTLELEEVKTVIRADSFLVATGSRARRLKGVPYDGTRVIDSDQIYRVLDPLPRRMVVVGAGVVGMEYASMLALAGVEVHLVSSGAKALGFVDQELVSVALSSFESCGGVFHGSVSVAGVEASGHGVTVYMDGGESIHADVVVYSVGREAATSGLGLDTIGVETDGRGVILVDEGFRTSVENVFAAGDVIGPPSLASTSREQGRLAALNLLGFPAKTIAPESIPYGIYTVPEMAWVGDMEKQDAGDTVVGRASYSQLAKGEMLKDDNGFLKLVFQLPDMRLVAAAAVGTDAAELIHVGKLLIEMKADLDTLLAEVFNYPTLAEAYKVAAMDAESRCSHGH